LINDHLDLVYVIIWSFAIATIVGAGLCLVGSVPLAKLTQVRFPIIAAGLIVVLFVSAYQEQQQFGVLQLMLLLGAIGWLMKVTDVPRAPFLIGFVLSQPMERYYFLTASLFRPEQWLVRPGVLVMIGILLIPFALAVRRYVLRRRAAAADTTADADDAETSQGALNGTWFVPALAFSGVVVFAGALVMSFGFSERAALMPKSTAIVGVAVSLLLLGRELLSARKPGYRRVPWRAEVKPAVVSLLWITLYLALVAIVG